MTYRVYTTEGIVLEGVPSGESSKYLWILTKKFGRVGVRASGLRKLESKLRFGLQPYALVEASLVRGKGGWRIVGARPIKNFHLSLSEGIHEENLRKRLVLERVFQLIVRLVHGQERNNYLYEVIRDGADFLLTHQVPEQEANNIERLLVLRVLHSLGYLKESDLFSEYIKTTKVDLNTLKDFSHVSDQSLREINQTLTTIQL